MDTVRRLNSRYYNLSTLQLCRYFGLTDGYFTGLQIDFQRIAAKRKLVNELKNNPLKIE
jgi:hypothetical protein